MRCEERPVQPPGKEGGGNEQKKVKEGRPENRRSTKGRKKWGGRAAGLPGGGCRKRWPSNWVKKKKSAPSYKKKMHHGEKQNQGCSQLSQSLKNAWVGGVRGGEACVRGAGREGVKKERREKRVGRNKQKNKKKTPGNTFEIRGESARRGAWESGWEPKKQSSNSQQCKTYAGGGKKKMQFPDSSEGAEGEKGGGSTSGNVPTKDASGERVRRHLNVGGLEDVW